VSKIFGKVILLAMLAVLSTSYSFAQEASKEKKVTNFKDWGRTCDKIPGVEEDVCFLFQRLRMKETEKVVMSTTVAINPKDNKPVISITVPLGMLLPPGVQMKVDKTEQVLRAPFLICMQVGCRASVVLDDDTLKRMKSGNQLLVAFVNANRKPATVPVSLAGFSAAFGSLKK